MKSSKDFWASLKPTRQAITCTGRRVEITPTDHKLDLVMNEALEDGTPEAIASAFGKAVRKYVCELDASSATYKPIANYEQRVYLAEELDLLFLLRWASHSTRLPFAYNCQSVMCDAVTEGIFVETKNFVRALFECGNPDCACSRVNEDMWQAYDALEDKTQWDNVEWMNARWSEVPATHLDDHPPNLIYSPSVEAYGEGARGVEVSLRLPRAAYRQVVLAHRREQGTLVGKKKSHKALRRGAVSIYDLMEGLVLSIRAPLANIDVSTPHEIRRELKNFHRDLMVEMDELVQSNQGGIDTRVDLACATCGSKGTVSIPFDRAFICPTSSGSTKVTKRRR